MSSQKKSDQYPRQDPYTKYQWQMQLLSKEEKQADVEAGLKYCRDRYEELGGNIKMGIKNNKVIATEMASEALENNLGRSVAALKGQQAWFDMVYEDFKARKLFEAWPSASSL